MKCQRVQLPTLALSPEGSELDFKRKGMGQSVFRPCTATHAGIFKPKGMGQSAFRPKGVEQSAFMPKGIGQSAKPGHQSATPKFRSVTPSFRSVKPSFQSHPVTGRRDGGAKN